MLLKAAALGRWARATAAVATTCMVLGIVMRGCCGPAPRLAFGRAGSVYEGSGNAGPTDQGPGRRSLKSAGPVEQHGRQQTYDGQQKYEQQLASAVAATRTHDCDDHQLLACMGITAHSSPPCSVHSPPGGRTGNQLIFKFGALQAASLLRSAAVSLYGDYTRHFLPDSSRQWAFNYSCPLPEDPVAAGQPPPSQQQQAPGLSHPLQRLHHLLFPASAASRQTIAQQAGGGPRRFWNSRCHGALNQLFSLCPDECNSGGLTPTPAETLVVGQAVAPLFNWTGCPAIKGTDLVIYLRAGDIFEKTWHPAYVQVSRVEGRACLGVGVHPGVRWPCRAHQGAGRSRVGVHSGWKMHGAGCSMQGAAGCRAQQSAPRPQSKAAPASAATASNNCLRTAARWPHRNMHAALCRRGAGAVRLLRCSHQ